MRILLFLATNLAVILLASITFRVLGLEQFMYQQGIGINLTGMLIFAAVFGMGGSFFSLLISKWMAKMSVGAQVIDQPSTQSERWLVDTVKELAAEGRHRHARSRRVRFAATQRIRHRREQKQRARRGQHRACWRTCAPRKYAPCSATKSATSRTATW